MLLLPRGVINPDKLRRNEKAVTFVHLYDKAKYVGINGQSKMSKKELIHALRTS
jgi:hypothetical protein